MHQASLTSTDLMFDANATFALVPSPSASYIPPSPSPTSSAAYAGFPVPFGTCLHFSAVSPIRRSQPKSASLGHPPHNVTHNAQPLVAGLSVVSALQLHALSVAICDVGILICDHPLSLTI